MTSRLSIGVLLAAITGFAGAAVARADDLPDKAKVDAAGNVVTGGLGFFPNAVTLKVGGTVSWLNTDFVAPHTATEDHGLWEKGGTYGATPINPAGFGPGTTVSRIFEAGTTHYYCRVHPTTMRATVSVPVAVSLVAQRKVTKKKVRSKKTGKVRTVRVVRKRYFVQARWAVGPPVEGQVYDAEYRQGGPWRSLRTATTETSARMSAGIKKGVVTFIRARLRSATDENLVTGWSPDASVTRP